MATQPENLQQIRVFRSANRERARHYGRKARQKEILPNEQKNLRKKIFNRLFLGLFQRDGEKRKDRNKRLYRVRDGESFRFRTQRAAQLFHKRAV